jgi:hypothetical protein
MFNSLLKKPAYLQKQQEALEAIQFSQASVIVPAEKWLSRPTKRLIDIVNQAVPLAYDVNHDDIAAKMKEYPHWPTIWPGEHYRLLSALVQVLQPKLIIEIGTATGYSLVSMKKYMPADARLVTFDIVPWDQVNNSVLSAADFEKGKVEQEIADLTDPKVFGNYAELLSQADFVFIDAAKDGVQEDLFIKNFKSISYKNKPIFMFDDIRLMNMITIWHNLDLPKWDISSFGHWAGTGLVDWTAKQ